MGTHLSNGPVVVGVDGSPASLAALRWAADAAVRHGRDLHLIHAFGWPAYAAAYGLPPSTWANDDFVAGAQDVLSTAAAEAHVLAPTVAVRPNSGVCPKPARSMASAWCVRAICGATAIQFRALPARP